MSLLSSLNKGFFSDFYDDFLDRRFEDFWDEDDYIILKKRKPSRTETPKKKQKFEVFIETPKKKKKNTKENEQAQTKDNEPFTIKEDVDVSEEEDGAIQEEKQETSSRQVTVNDKYQLPTTNVERTDEGMKITSKLPSGFSKDDVKIDVLKKRGQKYIVIKGEKAKSNEYQSFRNEFSLDDNIKLDEIKSKLKNSVLSITLPKKVKKTVNIE